jgi:hypothetical protein
MDLKDEHEHGAGFHCARPLYFGIFGLIKNPLINKVKRSMKAHLSDQEFE